MKGLVLLPRSGLNAFSIGLPVLLFIGLSIASPFFLTSRNISNIADQVAPLVLVSLGQLLVAIGGGIDLSVGSVMSVTSTLIASNDPATGLALALLVGATVGLANGFGSVAFGVHPLVMTLATGTFLQGFALLVMQVPGGQVSLSLHNAAATAAFGFPNSVIWMITAVAAVSFLLYRSRFGLRLYAIGANGHSAMLNGVPTFWPRIGCYMFSSFAAVAAGIYLTARVSAGDPTIGASYALDSVTAIALGGVQLAGGTGSILGAVLGALTLGLLSNGMNLLGVSPFIRTAVVGALLLFAISLQRRKVIGI